MVKENWTTEDEEQLCHSYLEISMNPLIRCNEKSDAFWKRVKVHYNDECEGSDRAQMDLNSRWNKIDESVLKFSGCYQRASYTNFDTEKLANALYKGDLDKDPKLNLFDLSFSPKGDASLKINLTKYFFYCYVQFIFFAYII